MNAKTFLLILVCNVSFANFVSELDVGKESGYRVFPRKDRCEAATGGLCLRLRPDLPNEALKVADVEEDDPTRPIWEQASQVTACDAVKPDADTPSECQLLGDTLCPDSHQFFWGDLNGDGESEAWCSRLSGYEKRTVRRLVEDSAKKAAWQAREKAKEDKKKEQEASIAQCLTVDPNDKEEIAECIKLLFRLLGHG